MAINRRVRGSLRNRILAFVGTLILLSLLGSTFSLYRITEVNRSLDAINHVSIPLGRLFVQLQSDTAIFKHEAERRLGRSHWSDARWKPRPLPKWIEDLIQSEILRASELVSRELPWADVNARKRWRNWVREMSLKFEALRKDGDNLFAALGKNDVENASRIYSTWIAGVDEWGRQLNWGVSEYDRSVRQSFAQAETSVSELRTGLEIILIVVVSLSLLMLWLGERALRPLNELTRLAGEIARRGLRKEDKSRLPGILPGRADEVSQLSREFHNMATALLEREQTVETQKRRLLEQNRMLAEIGELNENILNSIESILLVIDLDHKITQCNPLAAKWLSSTADKIIGTHFGAWPMLKHFATLLPENPKPVSEICGESGFAMPGHRPAHEEGRKHTLKIDDRYYGARVMPLRQLKQGGTIESSATIRGAIIVIDDLSDEIDLQDRLRKAENLAAVGRMSAQVAHEIRNPLHSIGLEAELAAELAARFTDRTLKQSLQSILISVDRLEKITENYLKLSRLSAGEMKLLDLGEILESVLATYASACEAQGVSVDWSREKACSLLIRGDRDLMEQALGNLFMNSMQALKDFDAGESKPAISFRLGNAESGRVWFRIEDNGPGISAAFRDKLFTPFVTTKAQGTGHGLSFVKKVIEDHGGTVRYVEGSACGGACFEIVLPPAPSESVTLREVNLNG